LIGYSDRAKLEQSNQILNNIKRNLQNSEKKLQEEYKIQNHIIAPIAPNA
jgi:hypothetical protein